MRSPHPIPGAIYYRDVPTRGRVFRLVVGIGQGAAEEWLAAYGLSHSLPGPCVTFHQHTLSYLDVSSINAFRAWAQGLVAVNVRSKFTGCVLTPRLRRRAEQREFERYLARFFPTDHELPVM